MRCRTERLGVVGVALVTTLALLVMPGTAAATKTVVRPDITSRIVKRGPESPTAAAPPGRMEVPLLSSHPAKLREAKARAARRWSSGAAALQPQASVLSPLSPLPRAAVFGGLNSPGMSADEFSGTPPDTTGAIGPSNYVEFVNSAGITVYNRNLSPVSGPVRLEEFVGYPSDEVFDPQIQWDDNWGRWIYAMDDIELEEVAPEEFVISNTYLAFGWSKTSDPTKLKTQEGEGVEPEAGWCSYFIPTESEFEDYPKLGHSNESITIGTNVFDLSTDEFLTARIWAISKPANPQTCPNELTGGAFGSKLSPLKTSDNDEVFTPVPANTADSSTKGYVVAADYFGDPQIMAWHVRWEGEVPTLVKDGNMTVSLFEPPPNVPQEKTPEVLDSLDGRLTNAVAVTDPAVGQEAVWTQHTIEGEGRSVVRWYELLPATKTVRQEGTISNPEDFVFNAAISPTRQGDAAAVDFNVAGESLFPEMHARSRDVSTPLNQMQKDVLLGESTGVAKDFSCEAPLEPCRWGDYAGASPDPSVPGIVWGSNQGLAAPLVGTHAEDARWTTRNFALVADETPPETMISGPGLTNDSTPSFDLSSNEPGSTFECIVDSGAFSPCGSPYTTPPLGDGPHSLQVRATDPAKNTDATPAVRAFTVDTVAPDTTIDSGPTGATLETTPAFTFSSPEAGATFECALDSGGFSSCSSPFTAPHLTDGLHKFQARAVDAAGNSDPSPAVREFSVHAERCARAKKAVAAAKRAVKKARKLVKAASTPSAETKATKKLKKARARLKRAKANRKSTACWPPERTSCLRRWMQGAQDSCKQRTRT